MKTDPYCQQRNCS